MPTIAETFDMKVMPYHVDCLEYLKTKTIAPIPRAICQGRALRILHREGLIEKTGIKGFWAVSDRGREFDYTEYLGSKPKIPRFPGSTCFINPTPDRKNRTALIRALNAIDHLKEGSSLFGQHVKTADLEFLEGRSLTCKFIYFAYPLGFPLKHIGWALRHANDNISDHYVTTVRAQYLELPSRRSQRPPLDRELYADLLNEGLSPLEIKEYFSSVERGEVL